MSAVVVEARERRCVVLRGCVQGVGFRPTVYRLATAAGLGGRVFNRGASLVVEVEGPAPVIADFLVQLREQAPMAAHVSHLEQQPQALRGEAGFHIVASEADATDATGPLNTRAAPLMPTLDLATCARCLAELTDPTNRRYRYPFQACTDCGPRWTIQTRSPYDRANTSMAAFAVCAACAADYHDPTNRRFHAQNVACPACGPRLSFCLSTGRVVDGNDTALAAAVTALADGQCVAVMGIGGFQLLVDASNEDAVARLRRRKQRPAKPLAMMVADVPAAQALAVVSPDEATLLSSAAAPIVLLRQRPSSGIAPNVAPKTGRFGIMLPTSPLHHLLLQGLGRPVVATSGNRSGEPLCSSMAEAQQRLHGIADAYLLHDRMIVQPVDDSVVQWAAGRPMVLRAARGYAPLLLADGSLADDLDDDGLAGAVDEPTVMGLGGHLKNTLCVQTPAGWVLGPHLGDLDTPEAVAAWQRAKQVLPSRLQVQPRLGACDRHPDYLSSQAQASPDLSLHAVQHHHAHAVAAMVEHRLSEPVLAVVWDGSGYGDDGGCGDEGEENATLWGGEFLHCDRRQYRRLARFLPFPLPGGEAAMRDIHRSLLGMQFASGSLPNDSTNSVLLTMLEKGINSPRCSSVGRIFDAVAALLNLAQANRFEGEAAMAVQAAAERWTGAVTAWPFTVLAQDGLLDVDWRPMLAAMTAAQAMGEPVEALAAQFHETLAAMAAQISQQLGATTVVLSGGCFQNALLLARTVAHLQAAQISVHWPQRIPPNDGGLSVGQAAIAHEQFKEARHVSGASRSDS